MGSGVYAQGPPSAPPETHDRLVWRLDDTTDVLAKRIAEHRNACDDIVECFETAGIP